MLQTSEKLGASQVSESSKVEFQSQNYADWQLYPWQPISNSPLKGLPFLYRTLFAGNSSSAMLSPACPNGTLRSWLLSNVTGGSSSCSAILWNTVWPLWNGMVCVVSTYWSVGSWNVTVTRSTSSGIMKENLPSSFVLSTTFFRKITLTFSTGLWSGPPTTFPLMEVGNSLLISHKIEKNASGFWPFSKIGSNFVLIFIEIISLG